MSLSRELAGFWSAQRAAGAADARWFKPDAAAALAADPALAALLDRVRETLPGAPPERVVLLVLRALEVQAGVVAPRVVDSELLATLPLGLRSSARATLHGVRDLIRSARREILALGYEIREPRIVSELHAAASRAVQITLICDREKTSGLDLVAGWPSGLPPPNLYTNRPDPSAPRYASMHSKAFLADARDLILTSANMTFHGLAGNIEIGVRLQGWVAQQAHRLLVELLESGILVRMNGETGG